jgi:hypothetical protein
MGCEMRTGAFFMAEKYITGLQVAKFFVLRLLLLGGKILATPA